jgi:hypothetical protein
LSHFFADCATITRIPHWPGFSHSHPNDAAKCGIAQFNPRKVRLFSSLLQERQGKRGWHGLSSEAK